MLFTIIGVVIFGFIAGLIARAVVPGNDALGFFGTVLLGIVGSFVGGFLGYVLFHHDKQFGAFQTSGFLGSIIGAIVALLIYRRVGGRRGISR